MSIPIYKGYLKKSPPDRKLSRLSRFLPKARWRRRYFVLSLTRNREPILEYFEDESGKKLKGKIDLETIDSIDYKLESKIFSHVFSLVATHRKNQRTYYLVAETEREMNAWVDHLCKLCKCISTEEEEDDIDSTIRRKKRFNHRSESPPFQSLPSQFRHSQDVQVMPPDPHRESVDENKKFYDVLWRNENEEELRTTSHVLQRQDSVPSEPAPIPPKGNSPMTAEQNYVNITSSTQNTVSAGDLNHNTSSKINQCVPPPPPNKLGSSGPNYYNQMIDDQHYDFPSMNAHIPPARIGSQQVHAYENGSMGLVPSDMPKEPSTGILNCSIPPSEPCKPKLNSLNNSGKDFRPKDLIDLPVFSKDSKSFKRERRDDDRVVPRRRITTEESSGEDDDDDDTSVTEHSFSRTMSKSPTSPSHLSNKGVLVPPNLSAADQRIPVSDSSYKKVDYSDLSLELPSTPSSPKKSEPATEYREIDMEKTRALNSVINKKPTQQSE